MVAGIFSGLHLFDWNPVRIRPSILANARHEPRDLNSCPAACYFKAVTIVTLDAHGEAEVKLP
jgi:hypothetical protein